MVQADQPSGPSFGPAAAADAPGAGDALAFRDVTCVRGGRVLFERLSFAVPPGGAALVTGPNGIGKSSLMAVPTPLAALKAVASPPKRKSPQARAQPSSWPPSAVTVAIRAAASA